MDPIGSILAEPDALNDQDRLTSYKVCCPCCSIDVAARRASEGPWSVVWCRLLARARMMACHGIKRSCPTAPTRAIHVARNTHTRAPTGGGHRLRLRAHRAGPRAGGRVGQDGRCVWWCMCSLSCVIDSGRLLSYSPPPLTHTTQHFKKQTASPSSWRGGSSATKGSSAAAPAARLWRRPCRCVRARGGWN